MKINQISVQNGLFLGLILITFTIVLSYTNPTMFLKSKTMLLLMPFIIILIKAANDFRRKNEGIATMGQLFNITFFCGAIAVLICSIFEYFLFNYINPDLIPMERQINLEAIELTKSMLSDEYAELQKTIIKETNMHSVTQTLTTFSLRLITPTALFALFVSLILKRDKKQLAKNQNT